jgi:hypothetical protein
MPFDRETGVPTNAVSMRMLVLALGKITPILTLIVYAALVVYLSSQEPDRTGIEPFRGFPYLPHVGAGLVVLAAIVGTVVRRSFISRAVDALVQPGGASRCFLMLREALITELLAVDFAGIVGLMLFVLAGLTKEPLYLIAGGTGLWVYFIMQHPEYEVIAAQAQQLAELEGSNSDDK